MPFAEWNEGSVIGAPCTISCCILTQNTQYLWRTPTGRSRPSALYSIIFEVRRASTSSRSVQAGTVRPSAG